MKSKQFICPYCGKPIPNRRMNKKGGKPEDSMFGYHYCGSRAIKIFDHLMVEEGEGAADGNAEQEETNTSTTKSALGPPSRRRRKELEELEAQIEQEDE